MNRASAPRPSVNPAVPGPATTIIGAAAAGTAGCCRLASAVATDNTHPAAIERVMMSVAPCQSLPNLPVVSQARR